MFSRGAQLPEALRMARLLAQYIQYKVHSSDGTSRSLGWTSSFVLEMCSSWVSRLSESTLSDELNDSNQCFKIRQLDNSVLPTKVRQFKFESELTIRYEFICELWIVLRLASRELSWVYNHNSANDTTNHNLR